RYRSARFSSSSAPTSSTCMTLLLPRSFFAGAHDLRLATGAPGGGMRVRSGGDPGSDASRVPDSGGALFQIEARGALAEVKWGNPTRVGVETRMCYPGSTMSKVSPASKPSAPRSRPGRTEKISVSLDRADVDSLRKRAKK